MSNVEIKNWVKSRDRNYLQCYTGIKTLKGLARFETSFLEFLALHTDFSGVKESMNAFKKSLK